MMGILKKNYFKNLLKFKTQKPLEIERNGRKFGITRVIKNIFKNSNFIKKNKIGRLDQKCYLGNCDR